MKHAHQSANSVRYPRLIADIGGTNARFAIEKTAFKLEHIEVLKCNEHTTLLQAILAYLASQQLSIPPHVGIAIANPVSGDWIQMTNHHWQFSIAAMKADLGTETLCVVNDFTAQALAITQMSKQHLTYLSGSEHNSAHNSTALNDFACAVVGPGTGLGVSGLVPNGRGGMVALSGEGGHVTFAPTDETERQLMSYATKVFNGHVSAERLLQGDGLLLIYRFFSERSNQGIDKQTERHSPADVTRGALVEKDTLCIEVLSCYCAILGSFCADVVLTLGGIGGVYLAGGIVPRFVDFLRQSDFRTRFEAKGRFADYLKAVPVYVVEHDYPGLLGASVALNNALDNKNIRKI